MFSSLRGKIIFFISLIMGITAAFILLVTERHVGRAMMAAEEASAKTILELVELNVQGGFSKLITEKVDLVSGLKKQLKSVAATCLSVFDEYENFSRINDLPHPAARQRAVEWVASNSFGETTLFIFDTSAKVIHHPDPEVQGTALTECKDIKGRNIADVMHAEKLLPNGDSAVFFWGDDKKPTAKKFGYFIPYRKWGLTICAFVEVEEIENEIRRKFDSIVDVLKKTFQKIKIGKSGFLLLFDRKGEVLYQPSGKGHPDYTAWENPRTGNLVPHDLMQAERSGGKRFRYVEPGPDGGREIETFIGYFKPFDWYLVVGLPVSEIRAPARALVTKQSLIIAAIFLLSILAASLLVSRTSRPLKNLATYAKDIPLIDFSSVDEDEHLLEMLPVNYRDEVGRLAASFVSMRSDLKKNVHKLINQQEILQKIIDNIPVMIAFYSPPNAIFFNREALEIIGIPSKAIRGTGVMRKCYLNLEYRQVWDYMREAPPGWKEIRMVVPDGREIETSWTNIRLLDGSYVGIGIDISERKQHVKKIESYVEEMELRNRQLAKLSSELTKAEHRERRRLAGLIHDHLQQLLVGAKINIETAGLTIPEDSQQNLKIAHGLILESIRASRSLTAELSPPVLYERGLAAALKWLANWMQESHGLNVELQLDPEVDLQQADTIAILFQSIRELLFNVVKHAGVSSARIRMFKECSDNLRIEVSDRGLGFDPDKIRNQREKPSGFGLISIHERLGLLGCRLEVRSAPGKGSTFTLVTQSEDSGSDERIRSPLSPDFSRSEAASGYVPDSVEKKQKFRVLLVDDHAVLRQGLSSVLGRYPDIEIAGEASDGEFGIRLAREIRPDVILMDVCLPKINGISATREIHSELPEIRIIGLSMFEEKEHAAAMFEAGAAAYLSKADDTAALLSAIRG